jgi:hypothetical protein
MTFEDTSAQGSGRAAEQPSPPLTRLWITVYALTILLACLHTGQSIVFFDGIPGDLADARVTNCILEHGFQSILGYARLLSPSQFYPVEGTLVYTDNHLGTLPIYAIYRWVGFSMERSFQGWFLTVIALDAASLLFLLRKLRISRALACPLAFFGASSCSLVLKCGHPQVLPYFPFILALACFLSFLRSADARLLAWAVIWFAYQNACYMYDGYFSVLILTAVFAVFMALAARRDFWPLLFQSARRNAVFLSCTIVISMAGLALLYAPYAAFSSKSGTRPMAELLLLAPNPGAWLSASAQSAFYSAQKFYKPGGYIIENTLFSGWVAWAMTLAALGAGLWATRGSDGRLAAVLAGSCVLLVGLITTWHGTTGNAYLWLADHISSLRAFRSFARIAYLLFVLQAAAIAVFLNAVHVSTRSRLVRASTVVVAAAIAVEQLSLGQFHYSPWIAQLRVAGLIEMWRKAGDHQVLIFAPGYSNQGAETINTDSWQAALGLHRFSINGYSGNQPATYAQFLNTPSVDNAKALLATLGLNVSAVSLVTDWPEAVKARLGIQTYTTSARIVPKARVAEITLSPAEETTLPITLHSEEPGDVPCDVLHIYASYRLYDTRGVNVIDPPSPRTFVHTVRPGDSETIALRMQAPRAPGVYEARLSMVHEGVAWWADIGAPGSVVKFVVR